MTWTFFETHPLPVIASIQLTPYLDQISKHVPPASSPFHVYSVAETCQSVLNSFRMELAKNPKIPMINVCHLKLSMSSPSLLLLFTLPFLQKRLLPYQPIYLLGLLFFFSMLSITVSLLTFCVSFTFFRRQWRPPFSHSLNNFCEELLAVSFALFTTRPQLLLLILLFLVFLLPNANPGRASRETPRRSAFTINPTTNSATNIPPHPVVASDPTSTNPNQIYPIVTAPFHQETFS